MPCLNIKTKFSSRTTRLIERLKSLFDISTEKNSIKSPPEITVSHAPSANDADLKNNTDSSTSVTISAHFRRKPQGIPKKPQSLRRSGLRGMSRSPNNPIQNCTLAMPALAVPPVRRWRNCIWQTRTS